MAAIPGSLETDAQPPMAVPLRHFVVGLGFLLAGVLLGTAVPLGVAPGLAALAHVHLLLAGWVCVTIMGAMTQFVPVWSGATLHSRRLATVQLWLVTAGLAGFATALLAGRTAVLLAFGGLMLAGFWVFVYNLGHTLWAARPWDVTERHFAAALCFFAVVPALGALLAAGYTHPVTAALPVTRTGLRTAHATLAVFGAVLTTVLGALYQLATMFTQSDLHGVDRPLRRIEEVGYPAGVVALAAGRLGGAPAAGRVGALLVLAGLVAFGVVLARRLHESATDWTPMLTRYAVAAGAMLAWATLTAPAWYADPLDPAVLFGAPPLSHLLLFGVVGFVVAGTLYHVVPFVVWVHRYSDALGLADVPMIDDLYDDRVATADFAATLAGGTAVVLGEAAVVPRPRVVVAAGGVLATGGFVMFAGNLWLVLRDHSPHSLAGLLAPSVARYLSGDGAGTAEGDSQLR